MTKDELIEKTKEFNRLFPEILYTRELVESGIDYPPKTIIVQHPEEKQWYVMKPKYSYEK